MALLKSSIEADDIITIRTVQGFEIVAKLISESSSYIKVNQTLLVSGATTIKETGVTKILWEPLGETFGTISDIEINSVNILIADATDDTLAAQYKTQVG